MVRLVDVKACPCGEVETPEKRFYSGRAICRACACARKAPRQAEYLKKPEVIARRNKKEAERRKKPTNRARYIKRDSQKSDERAGRFFDLTVAQVQEIIGKCCAYCGDSESLMTLDRIDNAIGHVLANVLPACARCNYFRRDMPFAAWQLIVPALREARELGLLGEWRCSVRN